VICSPSTRFLVCSDSPPLTVSCSGGHDVVIWRVLCLRLRGEDLGAFLEEDESLLICLQVGGWLDDDDEGVVATGVDEAVELRAMRWLRKRFF